MTGKIKGSTSAKEFRFFVKNDQKFARRRAADWAKDKNRDALRTLQLLEFDRRRRAHLQSNGYALKSSKRTIRSTHDSGLVPTVWR